MDSVGLLLVTKQHDLLGFCLSGHSCADIISWALVPTLSGPSCLVDGQCHRTGPLHHTHPHPPTPPPTPPNPHPYPFPSLPCGHLHTPSHCMRGQLHYLHFSSALLFWFGSHLSWDMLLPMTFLPPLRLTEHSTSMDLYCTEQRLNSIKLRHFWTPIQPSSLAATEHCFWRACLTALLAQALRAPAIRWSPSHSIRCRGTWRHSLRTGGLSDRHAEAPGQTRHSYYQLITWALQLFRTCGLCRRTRLPAILVTQTFPPMPAPTYPTSPPLPLLVPMPHTGYLPGPPNFLPHLPTASIPFLLLPTTSAPICTFSFLTTAPPTCTRLLFYFFMDLYCCWMCGRAERLCARRGRTSLPRSLRRSLSSHHTLLPNLLAMAALIARRTHICVAK